jgi:NADH dehydrogenase
MLGGQVARRLLRDGYKVRLLVRDAGRAQEQLGPNFAYFPGHLDDERSLERALDGCAAVHVSLRAPKPEDAECVEHLGTARVARVAARLGVGRFSYVSGYLADNESAGTASDRAKYRAEQAIISSGVPYTIFRPTYFMETLPRHIQGRLAIVLGRQPHPLHMVAAEDFTRIVSRALWTPEAAGRLFHVQGPEAITLRHALRMYCSILQPGMRVITLPLSLMSIVDRQFMHGELRGTLALMRVMQQVGELGDPSETNQVLGAPVTTLREWCEQQRAQTRTPRQPDATTSEDRKVEYQNSRR